jgi:hypothetical protein
VESLRHAISGAADAEGEIEWGVGTLGDHALDLLGHGQDHDALAVAQQLEERAGESGGGGRRAEAPLHLVAQIVVDIE